MKIASLTLNNFRRHEHSRIELAPVTLLCGPNGSGKSSVAEALRLALTGKTEALNDRNEGISDLIRRGEKQAEIVVELPEGDSIVRRIPGGLSITGTASTTNQKAAEASLALMMGGRPDQARLVLGPRLWKLDDKSRRETLGDVLRLYYTDVRAALEEQGEVSGLSLLELTRQVAGSVTNDLAGMEERAREARRLCKKDLERAQHRREELEKRVGDGPDQVGQIQAPSQTEVQKARLQVSTIYGALQMRQHAEMAVERARARLGSLEDELSGRVAAPDQRLREGRERLSARRQELQAAEADLVRNRHAAEEANHLRAQLRELWEALQDASSSRCPTCGGPLEQSQVESLNQRGKALADRFRAAQQDAAALPELTSRVEGLRRSVALGEAWMEEQGRLRWLAGTIQEARTHLEQEEQRLEGIPHGDAAAYKAAEQHLADLEQRVEWARAWQAHLAQVQQAAQEVEDLTRRRDALDRLCGWLGPNGYRHQVLQSRIEPLIHEVNGLLEQWEMSIDYEPGTLSLQVSTPRAQEPVPYHLLSDGEQLLVQLAHQAFLAVACGVRILVLDRVEALDKQAQQKLFRACFDLTAPDGTLDHVLLMAVDTGTVAFPVGVPNEALRRYTLPIQTPEPAAAGKRNTRRKSA